MTHNQDFKTIPDFIKWFNTARLANKEKWQWYCGTVAGTKIDSMKFYNCWIQVLQFEGYTWRADSGMFKTPGTIKTWLADEVANIVKKQG